MEKLSFTIDNVEMIQENPESNFALLALDFFASGDNLHDMYVSEDTLLRTADSIKNCPLVWKYDEKLDDIYTHDPEEVPCGFVPENTEIKSRKIEDGRTMLSVIAYVWKRYTGPLLSFFKRDGGRKPVSVEMSVYKTRDMGNGKTELLDYRYEGVTVLGSFVTPAIPLANASVLSFAKIQEEYEEDLEKEFSFSEIMIPNKVRDNVIQGLELQKEHGGGTSTGIAFARYLSNNKVISPDKVREIANYFSTHKYSDTKNVDWLLWGGDYGREWADRMVMKIDEKLVTFPYKSKTDINPALKGIDPPVSLAQANAIAAQADSIGSDEKKNGWAIAISSFRKTHHVEDGKWVKNKGSTAKASADEPTIQQMEYWEEVVEEDFAAKDMGKGEAIEVNKAKDAMSNSAWESVNKTELQHKVLKASNYKSLVHDVYLVVDEGWEDHPSSSLKYPVMQIVGGKAVYNRNGLASALGRAKGQNESGVVTKLNGLYNKLGLNSEKKEMAMNFQIETMSRFFADDDQDDNVKMAKAEIAKGEEADFGIIMDALYSKVTKMEEYAKDLAKKSETYMAENKELKDKAAQAEADKAAAEKEGEKKFNFPVAEMGKFFSDDGDEDDDVKMAKAEIEKGDEADFAKIVGAAYKKFCDMKEKMAAYAEKEKTFAAENEELKRYKIQIEKQNKDFAVDGMLKELSESVYLTDELKAELKAESEKYTLENIEAWKNFCKAKTFDFSIKNPKSNVQPIGLPFGGTTTSKEDIWKQ